MSATPLRRLLAILDGEVEDHRRVLELAVELAEAEHALLTLAKTRDADWLAQCACAFPMVTALPPVGEERRGLDLLARTAELVPQSVSVSTLLLGEDSWRSLRELLGREHYDLVLAAEPLLHGSRRLRRVLHDARIDTLAVGSREPPPAPAGAHPQARARTAR